MIAMKSVLVWAALGLVPALSAGDAGPMAGCPECECCGCCETGTCTCAACTCACCVEECPTAGAKAGREGCCGGDGCGC